MRRRVLMSALLVGLVGAGLGAYGLAGRPSSGRAGRTPAAIEAAPAAPARAATPPRVVHVAMCTPGELVRFDRARVAYAVTVRRRAVAYRAPGLRPFARFGHLNVNGVPTVFSVVAARVDRTCRSTWYRVELPLRPNGRTGWVRAGAVTERALHVRVVVDLSERRVTVYRGDAPLLVTTAAIGAPSTPTPTGSYYVNQKLVAPDPLGPYGPAALGISAFSPVLRHWAEGGPIAIHGTNEADLLGSAVSHGCIRVANDAVRRLWKLVPTGTPVLIRM